MLLKPACGNVSVQPGHPPPPGACRLSEGPCIWTYIPSAPPALRLRLSDDSAAPPTAPTFPPPPSAMTTPMNANMRHGTTPGHLSLHRASGGCFREQLLSGITTRTPRLPSGALARRASGASVQLAGDQQVKPYHCVTLCNIVYRNEKPSGVKARIPLPNVRVQFEGNKHRMSRRGVIALHLLAFAGAAPPQL